jgi:DNA-binding MarR family transcriptional regulator
MSDPLSGPLSGVAVYNPSLLGRDELVGSFVARADLLSALLDAIRRETGAAVAQHHLVVGQAGMGKTAFLRRLQVAIDEDTGLHSTWIPLAFSEESSGVARLSDLYESCLTALAEAMERRGEGDASAQIDDLVARLPHEEDERRVAALDALLDQAAIRSARFVLLIEGMEGLLETLREEESWALREALMHHRELLVVGTSARHPDAVLRYARPFYDFFQVHELRPLDDNEVEHVLTALARQHEAPEVLRFVSRKRARIRAFGALSGGNPRAMVLLYDLLVSGAPDSDRAQLELLLDRCTPAYTAAIAALAPQARQILHSLAIHWHPVAAAQLADLTRLDKNAVSSQLNRLVTQQIVEKVPFFPRSKTGFLVADRLFNLWYLMRTSRRERRRTVWLLRFLEMFYAWADAQEGREEVLTVSDSVAPSSLLHEAVTLARAGEWEQAVVLSLPALREAIDGNTAARFEGTVAFLAEAVRGGRASEAASLLERLGAAERWQPMHAALRAARDGVDRTFPLLAPEVRLPAERLLERMTKPSA